MAKASLLQIKAQVITARFVTFVLLLNYVWSYSKLYEVLC